MPRYDYRCTACADVFEIEHGMREHPAICCPVCGAPAERVLNASGIVFKGSGFYNTDQRGKKGGTEATSGSTGDAGASSDKSAAQGTPSAEKSAGSSDKPAACAAAPSCESCAAKAETAKA